ncbi:MAG: hypothetical protein DHS20C18_54670 [Saprospiraceae bacterium]|nr:MAG: hypothetical protein DHS20C18_54670 [Saprospiraceae bacterium]
MHEFVNAIEAEFIKESNATIALEQKAYMRNQFEFYGMKTETRRVVQKPFFIKAYLPPKSDLNEIVKTLWARPQRDYHYFSQELVYKYVKQLAKEDIELFEYMVTHNSWWDTVDFIATKLISAYFKTFPEQTEIYVNKWLKSNNMWLQRSALLFQLKWKKDIDTALLSYVIKSLLGSKEFFINKAIGWVLREYSRTDPAWVVAFTNEHELNPLSKREALRLLK